MLGGAGPAIAAVPLTVVWVGGSFVSLLTGIGAGKVGPVDAAQRVGYVFFMSVAQVGPSTETVTDLSLGYSENHAAIVTGHLTSAAWPC